MAKSLIIAATSLASASALVGPAAAAPRPSMPIVSGEPHLASSSSGASILALSSRRQFMASIVAGAATLTALPTPGHASYALYAASLDTINERKASGDWQKSIGSDTSALQEIQAGIAKKRPSYNQKAQKAPQYCAGQTAAVSPMMENRCQNIGVSKADQSNAMTDSYGNMNVGSYTSLTAEEKARAERRQALIREAADNARLRQQANRQ